MKKFNPENERIKHRYRVRLQYLRGYSETTIDQALSAIHDFESSTQHRPFRLFHIENARAFTRDLCARRNPKTDTPYSKATINGTLLALRKFVQWLASEPEGRGRIGFEDWGYFRLPENDARIARATRPKRAPSVEDVQRVLSAMPADTDTALRDRAVLAFVLLTCARVSAVVSARLKHVDLDQSLFFQDAREVRTKRSKTFQTWFYPVGAEVRRILAHWVGFLVDNGFGPDDPIFPKTLVARDPDGNFVSAGLSRECWANGGPVREIFRDAFTVVGLPPPNPHVIRDTLMQLAYRLDLTPEELKAWSQNMGHNSVLTTLISYGQVSPDRQAEIIAGLAGRVISPTQDSAPDAETVRRVVDYLSKKAS